MSTNLSAGRVSSMPVIHRLTWPARTSAYAISKRIAANARSSSAANHAAEYYDEGDIGWHDQHHFGC